MSFQSILQEIQQKIRQQEYIVTIHADEEMDDDGFAILDVESLYFAG